MLTHVQEIAKAVSNSYGDEFLTKITLALNKVISADYTFIARINSHLDYCKTEVIIAKNKKTDNIEYPLKDSPSAEILDKTICCYTKDVCESFPNDQLLLDMKIQAFVGIPLLDAKQRVIGILVALFEDEHREAEETSMLFQLYSGHIAAELERVTYEQELEEKIVMHTEELSNVENQLRETQQQLMESEKMSALGNLVAGVSHEVNTPLGISITTHSIIADGFKVLKEKLDSQSLSMKDMEAFRNTTESALSMQGENLRRAKSLIENFKKTAADQHQLEIETVDISQYYQRVISTLHSIVKPYQVNLVIECPEKIVLATYPGIHAQILTNLINNTVKHGFLDPNDKHTTPDQNPQENKITITITKLATDQVEVVYCDNGRGLSTKAKQQVFEPFFTTARTKGGIGLGMSIVFNLINKKLNGVIELAPSEQGACFRYTFTAN